MGGTKHFQSGLEVPARPASRPYSPRGQGQRSPLRGGEWSLTKGSFVKPIVMLGILEDKVGHMSDQIQGSLIGRITREDGVSRAFELPHNVDMERLYKELQDFSDGKAIEIAFSEYRGSSERKDS